MSRLEGVRHEDVIWLLGSLSALYRLPFEAGLIEQEFPPPYTLATLHEAARALGFRTGVVAQADVDWQKLPLPAIAFLQTAGCPGRATAGLSPGSDRKHRWSVAALLRSRQANSRNTADCRSAPAFRSGSHSACQKRHRRPPGNGRPSRSRLRAQALRLFLVHPRTRQAQGHLARRADRQPGDPARRPDDADLFTQVIIDKVVVHQTQQHADRTRCRAADVHALFPQS
jgi:hypothetical protein